MVRFDARYLFNSIAAVALVAGPSVAQSQDVKRHSFEVPAQDLDTSLQALALQSGITVLVDSKIVAGKQARRFTVPTPSRKRCASCLTNPGWPTRLSMAALPYGRSAQAMTAVRQMTGRISSSREAGCAVPRLHRRSSGSVRKRSAIPAKLGWATLSAVSRKASEAGRIPGSA